MALIEKQNQTFNTTIIEFPQQHVSILSGNKESCIAHGQKLFFSVRSRPKCIIIRKTIQKCTINIPFTMYRTVMQFLFEEHLINLG